MEWVKYKALNGTYSKYMHELLTVQEGVQNLRSVHNVLCLKEPRTTLVTGGDISFEKAAAYLWNCIPVSLKNTDSFDFSCMVEIEVDNVYK